MRRKSSGFSRLSLEDPLLQRYDSTKTSSSAYGRGGRTNQKIYIKTEDLTIVVAGFSTSAIGFAAYLFLCTFSIGLCFLLFRWLPRWKVRLLGSPKPLRECTWAVVEVNFLFELHTGHVPANPIESMGAIYCARNRCGILRILCFYRFWL